MSNLGNKRIILGITGGIAAYKSAEIARRLQDHGAEVRVVMTEAATEFIRPLTLQALTGHPVHTDLLDADAESAMGHIELARWADLLLIAPATANFISTMVYGSANSLLGAIYLATSAKTAVAPAMNQAMWSHAASQENIKALKSRGTFIIEPDIGAQACGDVGPGRLQQPDIVVEQLADLFTSNLMTGKKVVITAGPTRESLDPVRYISNHSSGKMGYALAAAMAEAGATVTLISGPVALDKPQRCQLIDVICADEMLNAARIAVADADILIAAAAVADYRAAEISEQKIKKKSDKMTLNLVKNPDIVGILSNNNPKLFSVGFAAETENIESYGKQKLAEKKLDAIIVNDVSRTDIGFNSDDNEVVWIDKESQQRLRKKSKAVLARELIELLAAKMSD
jgi:phosphopantothenoylcysteine decarboxylase/phosphopantothenate--cysteine ligase